MGQRAQKTSEKTEEILSAWVWETPFGWWGIWGHGDVVAGLTLGHHSPVAAWKAIHDRSHETGQEIAEADWYPELRERLDRFCQGEIVDFLDIKLAEPKRTSFQQAVIRQTRRLKFGKTLSYAELAAKSGYPNAARAVGTVMSSNLFPILIPCHRVLGSGGGLGGYSAPQGTALKRKLLEMEGSWASVAAMR